MKETGLKTSDYTREPSMTFLQSHPLKSTLRSPTGGISNLAIPSLKESFQDKLAQTISAQLRPYQHVENDEESSRPGTSSNRLRTLKIFKQKIMTEKKEGYDLYSGKKSLGDPIRPGDSENTVKYLVSKTKKQYESKKKPFIKGTMYVNDLWAAEFEKGIIKQARIDKELARSRQAQRKSIDRELPNPLEGIIDTIKPMTVPSRDSSLDDLNTPELPKKVHREKYFLLGKEHRFQTERSEEASSAGLRKRYLMTEENTTDFHPFPKKASQPNLPLLKIDDFVMSGIGRKYSGNMEGSQSTRNLSTRKYGDKLGQIQTDRFMYTETGEGSPGTASSRGKSRIQWDLKTRNLEMRMFLGATSQQVNLLMDDCETELREKPEFITKLNDLKGLFMNPRFDKKKRQEMIQKQKTMGDCQYMIDRMSPKNNAGKQAAGVKHFKIKKAQAM